MSPKPIQPNSTPPPEKKMYDFIFFETSFLARTRRSVHVFCATTAALGMHLKIERFARAVQQTSATATEAEE